MITDVTFRNNVNRFGSGEQTLLFAHGYGCDQTMWRYVTPAFEQEYEIVLFDHVGSGNSDLNSYDFDKYNSLNGYASDIIELCDELNLDNVTLVAHSVSTMIAVLTANYAPNIFRNLLLIGPSPRYINDDEYYGGFSKQDIDELIETLESNFLGWSEYITPVIAGDPSQPEVTDELYDSFCKMNPGIAQHFAKVTFLGDNRDDLPDVTVPSLIIQSHPDAVAPVEVGEYVHKRIPDSSYVQLNTPGHCPHLSAPEQTIKAMKNFLGNKQ